MAKEITIRQAKFVKAFLSGKSAVQAALEAGYSAASARTRGYELLNQNEHVMKAVADARKELRQTTGLNAETAHARLEWAIGKAVEQKNMTAAVRALELQAKLAGLLDKDKGGGNAQGFTLIISGVDSPASSPAPAAPKDITPDIEAQPGNDAATWEGPRVQDRHWHGAKLTTPSRGIFD